MTRKPLVCEIAVFLEAGLESGIPLALITKAEKKQNYGPSTVIALAQRLRPEFPGELRAV